MCPEINNEVKQTDMTIKERQAVVVCRWQREDRVCSVSHFCTVLYTEEKMKTHIHSFIPQISTFVFHMGAEE